MSAQADGGTMFVEICDCLWWSASGGVDWDWPTSMPITDNALERCISPAVGPVIDWEEAGLGG